MNYHYINMVIKKLVETTPNSLNLLGVGELTPYDESMLTPGIAVGSIEKENIGKALDSVAKTVKETTNTVIDKTKEFKDTITK